MALVNGNQDDCNEVWKLWKYTVAKALAQTFKIIKKLWSFIFDLRHILYMKFGSGI